MEFPQRTVVQYFVAATSMTKQPEFLPAEYSSKTTNIRGDIRIKIQGVGAGMFLQQKEHSRKGIFFPST